MKVTVAICTWNRSALLAQTLESMTSLDLPRGVDWQLIVVDNNSPDDTSAVIERYKSRLPLLGLFERRPGQSYAANLAADHATGDLLIWTDDDVQVTPGWLSAYVKATGEWPDAAFFVGKIDPLFEVEPPPVIRRHLDRLRGLFVIVDHGPETRRMLAGEALFGANMAFRMDVAKGLRFDENIGRAAGQLIGGADTLFVAKVCEAGGYGVWVPDARLAHFNTASRVTMDYVKRWYLDSGRLLVRNGSVPTDRTIAGIPPWAAARYVKEQAKRLVHVPRRDAAWLEALQQAMILEGIMRESRAVTGRRHSHDTTPAAG